MYKALYKKISNLFTIARTIKWKQYNLSMFKIPFLAGSSFAINIFQETKFWLFINCKP